MNNETPEDWGVTSDSRWYHAAKACLDHLDMIPEHCRYGMALYVMEGVVTGDFLNAVICNDLMHSVDHADSVNMSALPDYAKYLYNYAPVGCYGSPLDVNHWVELGGIKGINRKEVEEAKSDSASENNP